jgi:hypothetical protein
LAPQAVEICRRLGLCNFTAGDDKSDQMVVLSGARGLTVPGGGAPAITSNDDSHAKHPPPAHASLTGILAGSTSPDLPETKNPVRNG